MAKARVVGTTNEWSVSVTVQAEQEHPDALDQITSRARDLFAEVMADKRAADADTD